MFEIIPAAFVCIIVVLLVLKWKRGDFEKSAKKSRREGGGSAPNVPDGPKTFDGWAFDALSEFDETCGRISKRRCDAGDLALLRDMRSAVLEEYNAQIRFSPNDDATLAELGESMRKADDYMTTRMRSAQATNPALIAVRGPMSCGDGDAFREIRS